MFCPDQYLEPLYNDFRKLKVMGRSGGSDSLCLPRLAVPGRLRLHPDLAFAEFSLSHMDEFADDLLHLDRVCDIALPRIQVAPPPLPQHTPVRRTRLVFLWGRTPRLLQTRYTLELTETLEPRVSLLEDDDEEEEEEEEEEGNNGGDPDQAAQMQELAQDAGQAQSAEGGSKSLATEAGQREQSGARHTAENRDGQRRSPEYALSLACARSPGLEHLLGWAGFLPRTTCDGTSPCVWPGAMNDAVPPTGTAATATTVRILDAIVVG
jgi:hypothetical protein